ncbi:hypothetical protein JN11_01594 [Mucilaginibacter frigoritolerans]|jgi:hypothetical protein|uniref:Uncharacterized protein n=1 Tax=Mucilaginibacter frigoritolerans TaxID=652788 RepID=A0A562U6K7_9SPHI|nr:hypothetical protein [Mucilaginibacter frigoritolerans]TWJ01443.1 hypothetical protein JN11_01594 [Mucilaginibacter frigoritolerans]
MKKAILILFLVIAASAITKANALTAKVSAPVSGHNYAVSELLSAHATVQYAATLNNIAAIQLPYGYVTDGDGNIIGYWVYDPSSGVLLIVLYAQ